MSERPASLKSPVPIACQAGPGLGLTGPPPMSLLPFISQIETWPLVVFWKSTSERPSPLKSPVPIAFQACPGLGLTAPPPIKVLPFISQIETWPLLVFWNRISERPAPLKSPLPIAFQLGPGLALTAPPPIKLFPFISQTEAWPLAFCHRMSERLSPSKAPPGSRSRRAVCPLAHLSRVRSCRRLSRLSGTGSPLRHRRRSIQRPVHRRQERRIGAVRTGDHVPDHHRPDSGPIRQFEAMRAVVGCEVKSAVDVRE